MIWLAFVVFCAMIGLVCTHTSVFAKALLVSKKLCNNDLKYPLVQKCYNSQYEKEVECDSRRIKPNSCMQLNATIDEVTFDVINELGRIVDLDSTIRRITIDFSQHMNITSLGELIDTFLLPRPMWSAVSEPFNLSDPRVCVFERYSQLWDPYFNMMSEAQFPPSNVCSRRKFIVGRADCIHPGYSDVRKYYFEELGKNPVISAIYVPMDPTGNGEDTEATGFISASDCPADHTNKWTCAFLQMTNCTLPVALETLKRDDQVMHMFNASIDGGKVIHHIKEGFGDVLTRNHEDMLVRRKRIEQVYHKLPRFVYTSPFTHAANMFKFHGPDEHQVPEFLFMEFLFRKTALYRRKVAEVLAGFRAKYGLGDAIRTKDRRFVAVHIRRSDRMLKGVNMTEFCHNLLVQRFTGVPQNCTYGDGEVHPCRGNEEVLGCDKLDDIPVGSVTLDAAILEAELLIGPSIRNMIIFSEDIQWVEAEIRQAQIKHPEWKFYSLDPPPYVPLKNDEDHHGFDVRRGGTASGVFFHATIDLVQECDALLGHFNSGVPMTFAGAMCHHHAGMEGICPPVYNLKNKL